MSQHIGRFLTLTALQQKKIIAASQWGDGPYTRMIIRQHFPAITADEIPALISHCRTLTA